MVFLRRRRAPPAAAALLLLALAAPACDSSTGPTPLPSPTSGARVAGGPLTGAYLLEITPSVRCPAGVRTTFRLDLAAAGTTRYPGVQGTHTVDLQRDQTAMELEAISASNAIRGGLATRHDGVLSQEDVQVWVHAIAEGAVTSLPGGRGEVLDGTLVGYVAYSSPGAAEGALGFCTQADHRFRMTAR